MGLHVGTFSGTYVSFHSSVLNPDLVWIVEKFPNPDNFKRIFTSNIEFQMDVRSIFLPTFRWIPFLTSFRTENYICLFVQQTCSGVPFNPGQCHTPEFLTECPGEIHLPCRNLSKSITSSTGIVWNAECLPGHILNQPRCPDIKLLLQNFVKICQKV